MVQGVDRSDQPMQNLGDDPYRETTKAYAQVLEPAGTILYFSLVEELEGKGGLSYSFQIV